MLNLRGLYASRGEDPFLTSMLTTAAHDSSVSRSGLVGASGDSTLGGSAADADADADAKA